MPFKIKYLFCTDKCHIINYHVAILWIIRNTSIPLRTRWCFQLKYFQFEFYILAEKCRNAVPNKLALNVGWMTLTTHFLFSSFCETKTSIALCELNGATIQALQILLRWLRFLYSVHMSDLIRAAACNKLRFVQWACTNIGYNILYIGRVKFQQYTSICGFACIVRKCFK